MPKQTIGEFLATQRKAKGYTQQHVADILGVSNRTLSAWETNKAYPDILTLPALAELYGVTTDEILKGERSAEQINTEELSEKAQSDLYKNRLAQYSAKNTALTSVGICSAATVTLGLIFMFVLFWLGITLIVLGLLATLVVVILLVSFSKNAVASAGIYVNDENLSAAEKRFILNIAVMRTRILNLFGLVWLICLAALGCVYLLFFNNILEIVFVFILIPLILPIVILSASAADRNKAIKMYGTEENNIILKRNKKLLLKCMGFSSIPVVAVVLALVISAIVANNSWLVLFEGGEKEFRQYMHTLDSYYNLILPEYTDEINYEEPIPLEIPDEIKSGEYVPVYGDIIYVCAKYAVTNKNENVLSGLEVSLKVSYGEGKEDFIDLCDADLITVENSGLTVFNVRYAAEVRNFGNEIKAEYKNGKYTALMKSSSNTVVLGGIIAAVGLAAISLAVGATVYFCKRSKQKFTV